MADSTLPPLPLLPPILACNIINLSLKDTSSDINPDKVVVFVPPDPSAVLKCHKRYVNAAHIKWIVNNIITTATKFVKLELTGECIFWVPNAKELLEKYKVFKVPLV